MRLIATLLIVCFLIGGMYAYLKFADSVVRPNSNFQPVAETKTITAEINRSATLYADSGFDIASLKVTLADQVVLASDSTIAADEELEVELPNVERGRNTIFIQANFEDPEQFLSDVPPPSLYAIEVIIRSGDNEIARQTFISTSSALPVGGQVLFDSSELSTSSPEIED